MSQNDPDTSPLKSAPGSQGEFREPDPEQSPPEKNNSPRWGSATKLIVGLSITFVFAFLLFRFLNLVGPLLLAFILAYLIYPIADVMKRRLRMSWRWSVTILYLLIFISLIGSITVGGLTVVEQVQNLIGFLTRAIENIPGYINNLVAHPIQIGSFALDLGLLDVDNLSQQVLGVVQPILSQAGTSMVTVASSAASFIGWIFFILLISYFILSESGGFRIISFTLPGYADDMQRLGNQLGRVWNAFLRGQITIVLMTILIYTFLLGVLGVKFYFGLAILAGVARFIPYVGPFITWTSYGLVCYFQGSTIFGISPLPYAGLVVGLAWLIDLFMDNFITPRLMSDALKVHPAAVMVSALVAFNLLGVVGVVMAAPVLATVKLFLDYIFAKLFDRNPWEKMETISPPLSITRSIKEYTGKIPVILKKVAGLFSRRADEKNR